MRRFKPNNIMHVLHDDLIPLFHTLRQLDPAYGLGVRRPGWQTVFLDGWDPEEYFDLYALIAGQVRDSMC
jgi:protein O-mannose beta-1,4-N-acetylglucosaminyltransferase